MFCSNCGNQIADGTSVCPHCLTITSAGAPQTYYAQQSIKRDVPKCTCCGHVGEMKAGPLLTGKDLLWFFMLLCAFGAGFIYLAYKIITRFDPKKREKICPNCGSINMFTYIY